MEIRVARLWFWEGYFSRSGIDLRRHYHPEPLVVTDLDLLAYDIGPSLQARRTIGEVKTGTSRNAPKPLDRIIWLRGLKELVGVDHAELVSTNAPSARARNLARSIGVTAQSQDDLEYRENLADVLSVAETGSHGERAFVERNWVHKHCRSHQNLERAFWFLTSEVWFCDEITACKRLIGLYRQLGLLWTPEIVDEDSRALRWLLAETVSVFSLNAVIVASEALRAAPDLLTADLGDRLSAGLVPAEVMRQIAMDVDKYVGGLLTAAQAPASLAVEAMGALHPEAPSWTEQFVEFISRVAAAREAARMLPRQIDLLVYERVVWKRKLKPILQDRLSFEHPDTERLIRLVAAFLRGQASHIEVIDRALTTAIKTAEKSDAIDVPTSEQGRDPHSSAPTRQPSLLDNETP